MRPSPLALALLALLSAAAPARAERQAWKLEETYAGPHQDHFQKLRYEVPILIRQSLIDIAVRMGLDFNEGWSNPLVIRFADGSPAGVESALAYVEFFTDGTNSAQRLTINLAAYASEGFNFDKVFRHELLHAMLNDALGPDAAALPRWVHEGMAVYAAEQGPQMMQAYVGPLESGQEQGFINGLDNHTSGADYVEDYLAFEYIRERHGVNSLQGFSRALVAKKGNVAAAIEASCFEDYPTFQENARAYSLEALTRMKRTLRGRQGQPF